MSIRYDFNGLDRAEQQLSRLIEQTYPAEFKQMVLQIAFEVEGLAKENTPVDTSRLKDGWKVGDIVKRSNEYYVEVSNNIEYGIFVEDGHHSKEGVKMFEIALSTVNARLPSYLRSWLSNFASNNGL